MNTTTQQIPSNPALNFAQSILDETNNGLELIEILRDIAEDCDEKANTNDRIAATNILNDRAFGKPPKQLFHSQDPVPDPAPETDDNDVDPAPYSIRGAIRESPPPASHEEPESPRLVSQINGALHKSLGPTPTAPQSTEPFDPNSIHFTIQQHILAITNNGQTLRDILLEIARAEDNPRVTPYHRRRAVILLIDRSLGTDPTPVLRAVQERPELGQSVPHNPEYPPGYIPDPTKSCVFCSPSLDMHEGHEGEHRFDHEGFAESVAEVNRMMEEKGLPLFDPANPPKSDRPINTSGPSREWVAANTDLVRKEADEFWAKLELQEERRKQWPEIEERRRKKLAQIYPSHSEDDGDPPDP